MIGSICGDIIGSVYEFNNTDDPNFRLFTEVSTFTDDTVLTVATADVLLNKLDGNPVSYVEKYQEYFNMYPKRGWGGHFALMASQNMLGPYNSFGNGSAMRVGPIGLWFNTVEDVLIEARKSAEATHNHPEGVKGAQAVALATHLAVIGRDKSQIKNTITGLGMYDLSKHYSEFPKVFDETCQGTVPMALSIFFETDSYEAAIRAAILNGGDVDTVACIVGGIAEAYYGYIPEFMADETLARLPEQMKTIIDRFYASLLETTENKNNVGIDIFNCGPLGTPNLGNDI